MLYNNNNNRYILLYHERITVVYYTMDCDAETTGSNLSFIAGGTKCSNAYNIIIVNDIHMLTTTELNTIKINILYYSYRFRIKYENIYRVSDDWCSVRLRSILNCELFCLLRTVNINFSYQILYRSLNYNGRSVQRQTSGTVWRGMEQRKYYYRNLRSVVACVMTWAITRVCVGTLSDWSSLIDVYNFFFFIGRLREMDEMCWPK